MDALLRPPLLDPNLRLRSFKYDADPELCGGGETADAAADRDSTVAVSSFSLPLLQGEQTIGARCGEPPVERKDQISSHSGGISAIIIQANTRDTSWEVRITYDTPFKRRGDRCRAHSTKRWAECIT